MRIPRLDPRWYAAPLVVAVISAGALSGSAIGSTSTVKRERLSLVSPQAAPAPGTLEIDEGERLPDHYPLVTPEGTIPVAALSVHGRLRKARGNWWLDQPDHVAFDSGLDWGISDSEIERLENWRPKTARRAPEEAVVRVHAPDKVRTEVVESSGAKLRERMVDGPGRPIGKSVSNSKQSPAPSRPVGVGMATADAAAAPKSMSTD